MKAINVLGVDIGATGIKGGVVDTGTGELITDRMKLDTPKPATPENIATVVHELVKKHNWDGPIGCGFPAIVKGGKAMSAANIDKSCIGVNFEELLSNKIGMPVFLINDADAAGIAEMEFGKGKGRDGVVILITIGTGLGSAVFINGHLLPNTELGHFYLNNEIAERLASNSAREREGLSWDVWGGRFQQYLTHLKRLFSPDLVLLGGGVSKRFDKYESVIEVEGLEVLPAKLLNNAGSIGAAFYASKKFVKSADLI